MTISFRELEDNLKAIIANIPNAVDNILEETSKTVETKAKEDCPKASGALADSITSTVKGNTAYITAGNATIDYAVKVHEDLSVHHSNGGAKFIERNLNQMASDGPGSFKQIIADEILSKLK